MDKIFPTGTEHYLIGGLLVGAGTALMFALSGKRMGASGTLSVVVGFFSRIEVLQRLRSERSFRLLFTAGLLLGGLAWVAGTGSSSSTQVPLWQLALGGFLVGVGTRAARGCTSGHGVCGLSSRHPASLVHVLTFMGTAITTALITGALL